MPVRFEHLVFVRENALEIQTIRFLKSLFQQWDCNSEADEVVITIRSVAALRHLQNVESKFCLYVRQRVIFIRNRVAELLFQLRIQDRDRAIRADPVAIVVRGVVSERAERKSIAVKVLGIAQQSQDKISAPHVVCQVAEEKTSVWVIAHVLNNDAPIRIPVRFFEFFSGGAGKALQK